MARKSAGRAACQSPLCPYSDQIPQPSEMKRCARSGRDQLSTDYPLRRVRLARGMRHRHFGLYLRFLGALMPQSMQKKMRMLHYSDHDERVTAQIYPQSRSLTSCSSRLTFTKCPAGARPKSILAEVHHERQ